MRPAEKPTGLSLFVVSVLEDTEEWLDEEEAYDDGAEDGVCGVV